MRFTGFYSLIKKWNSPKPLAGNTRDISMGGFIKIFVSRSIKLDIEIILIIQRPYKIRGLHVNQSASTLYFLGLEWDRKARGKHRHPPTPNLQTIMHLHIQEFYMCMFACCMIYKYIKYNVVLYSVHTSMIQWYYEYIYVMSIMQGSLDSVFLKDKAL